MRLNKTVLLLITIFICLSCQAQIISLTNVDYTNVSENTYVKDLDGKLDPFIGTWKWINLDQIVTFELTKVTQQYFPEDKVYKDYMIGNYSYSTDGGISYIVNTITSPIDNNPSSNPMYTPCVEGNKLIFIFRDVVLDKGYCYATFEFIAGSLNQMEVKIENPKEIPGRFEGEPEYNYNFTLPTDIILTKQ